MYRYKIAKEIQKAKKNRVKTAYGVQSFVFLKRGNILTFAPNKIAKKYRSGQELLEKQ